MTPPRLPTRTPVRDFIIAGVLAVSSAVALLVGPEFTNDHFKHLAEAQQVLLGSLPIRDFFSPYGVLETLIAAAIHAVTPSLLGTTIFEAAALGFAYGAVFLLSRKLGAGTGTALAAVVIAFAPIARLYSYSKIVLPMLGLVLLWRYTDSPSRRRLVALAGLVALAFLTRYDLGVYLALAAAVAITVAHPIGRLRAAALEVLVCGTMTLALLTPYLIFVQTQRGLIGHFRTSILYVSSEANRTGTGRFPVFELADAAGGLFDFVPVPNAWPRVSIRWHDIPADQRHEHEQAHTLTEPRPHDEDLFTWHYSLADPSPENIAAILADPLVSDTNGLDRSRATLTDAVRQGWRRRQLDRLNPIRWFRARPALAANAAVWLYYCLMIGAAVSVAGAAVDLWRDESRSESRRLDLTRRRVLVAGFLALVVGLGLGRAPLGVRLADITAPGAVAMTGLLCQWQRRRSGTANGRWQTRARRALPGALMLSMVTAALLAGARHGETEEFWDRVLSSGEIAQRVRELARNPPYREAPDGFAALGPPLAYLDRCTSVDDRLLIAWFGPELLYYSRRGFAGGVPFWLPGYYSHPSDQRLIVQRLRAESLPLLLVRPESFHNELARSYPIVYQYLTTSYRLHASAPFGWNDAELWVESDPTTAPTLDRTGLPCFTMR